MQIWADSGACSFLDTISVCYVVTHINAIPTNFEDYVDTIEQYAEKLGSTAILSPAFEHYCRFQELSPARVWNPIKQARLILSRGYRSHGKVIDYYMFHEMLSGVSIQAFDIERLASLRLTLLQHPMKARSVRGERKMISHGEWVVLSNNYLVHAASLGVNYPYRIRNSSTQLCYQLLQYDRTTVDVFEHAVDRFTQGLVDYELIRPSREE